MKRLIAIALLTMSATILLAGCHARNTDIKPVSSALHAASHACGGDRCAS